MIYITISHSALWPPAPYQVENTIHTLQVHCQTFNAVGNLTRDRPALEATDLLKVGELRHLHTIQPDFPAQPPGTERR